MRKDEIRKQAHAETDRGRQGERGERGTTKHKHTLEGASIFITFMTIPKELCAIINCAIYFSCCCSCNNCRPTTDRGGIRAGKGVSCIGGNRKSDNKILLSIEFRSYEKQINVELHLTTSSQLHLIRFMSAP